MIRSAVDEPLKEKAKRPKRTPRLQIFNWRCILVTTPLLLVLLTLVAAVVPTTRWIAGGGYITTDLEVELRPSVEGPIAAWLVTSGDTITKDQPLIELDNAVQKADLDHATSELKAREAQLSQMLSSQDLERLQRKEQVARGEQNLKLAQAYLDRMTAGTGDGFSPKEVDEARLKVDVAASQLAELKLPRDDVMDKQVTVLREQIETAKKTIAVHAAELRLREIRSPMAGVVQFNRFEPGEVVKPDHVLGQVFDRSAWVVKLKLPERSVPHVQMNQEVEVALAAYSTLSHGYVKGKLTRITPVISPSSSGGGGFFYAEALIDPPPDLAIQPGMTATGYVAAGKTNWLWRVLGIQ